MTKEKRKLFVATIASIVVLLVVFFVALSVGRYTVTLESFWQIITGSDSANPVDKSVVFNLRLPRTIVALLVGVALSFSGLVYQENFQNKLVSPDFL